MKSFIILLCVTLMGVNGCKSKKEVVKLDGMKWELKVLNNKEVVLSDPENKIFILFDDVAKRVNGRAACNRFFGDYEMTDAKLKFFPMGATRMACPNDSDWEFEFFQMLETVDNYKVKDKMLYFLSKDNIVAEFEGILLDAAKQK